MKKITSILFLAAIVLSSACSSSAKENVGEEKEISEVKNTTAPANAEHSGAIHLTKADFLAKVANYESNPNEWVYLGDKPAIIDFYADWCRPCKIAAPILDELAAEYKDDIYVYKIDTEKEQELAAVFGIRSIPAFLFVPKNGKPQMSNGIAKTPAETKEMFKSIIDEFLLGKTPN